MLTTQRRLFIPNAVFIPVKDGTEGRDFDRSDCTLLMVDGEFRYGEVYTEAAWQNDAGPAYIQRRGDFFLPDDTDIPTGRVQLLPDACIVKIPDRDYWCDDVQAMTKRIFALYALDRRQHIHLCEVCASYELWFIEHQYEATDQVDQDDEEKREELHELILDGGRYEEQVVYEHRKDIDPLFLRGRRCRPGFLPRTDAGGYRVRGLRSVTWDGIMEELLESRCNADL